VNLFVNLLYFADHAGTNFKVWTAGNSLKTRNKYAWAVGDFISNDHSLWAEGEPSNEGGSEFCVMATFNSNVVNLKTKDCDDKAMVICHGRN
jgi:hypothetical protein